MTYKTEAEAEAFADRICANIDRATVALKRHPRFATCHGFSNGAPEGYEPKPLTTAEFDMLVAFVRDEIHNS